MLNIDHSRRDRQKLINDEVNHHFLQTHPGSSVQYVVEASSILQTTTYRITTEHLLFKPYKTATCSTTI